MRSRELATELQRIVEMSSALSEAFEPGGRGGHARHMSASLDAEECAIQLLGPAGRSPADLGYWRSAVHDEKRSTF